LRDEEIDAARHPQADDLAWPDSTRKKAARNRSRLPVELGISEMPPRPDHRLFVAVSGNRRGENFGEDFIPVQTWDTASAQYGFRRDELRRTGRTDPRARRFAFEV
jgi:hypothetical protein